MSHPLDTNLDLMPRTKSKYFISSEHRGNRNPNKSLWIISHEDEVECFIHSKMLDWVDGLKAWGLKLEDKIVEVVGVNRFNEKLKLAKFISDNTRDVWHGYPADYLRKSQDIPSTKILQTWVISGYISKSNFRKIRQGISCNL